MAVEMCEVAGCLRRRARRAWCDSHYQRWRRTGDPGLPIRERGLPCEECGAERTMPNSRRFCSQRCQMLESRRRRGERCANSLTCEGCGTEFSVAPNPGERKKRSDTKYCGDCSRLKALITRLPISVADVRSLGDVCAICNELVDLAVRAPHPRSASIDHRTPVVFGGLDVMSNLQIAHLRCNQRKSLKASAADDGHSARQRLYRSRAWRNFAAQVRADEPTCRSCDAPTQVVDHIVAIADGGHVWDRTNIQGLCRPCHNTKSQREYRSRYAAAPSVGREGGQSPWQ